MIFSTIENEASISGLKITNVFSEAAKNIRTIFSQNFTNTISFDGAFSKNLVADETALMNYHIALQSGMSDQEAFNATMTKASAVAQLYAQNVEITGASVAKFTTQQKMSEISTMAQNKSFANVRSIINTYNTGLSELGLTQEQFVQSVSQGNAKLGNYISSVGVGNAKMSSYIGSLVKAKVVTIGMRVATMALNTALSMGISAGISFLISKIQDLIVTQEEAYQTAQDAANKAKQTADSHKEETNSLAELIDKYEELAKSGTQDASTRSEIRNIQEEILNLTVSQSDKVKELTGNLDLVNGKLDTQLGKLKAINEEALKENADDYYDAYIKARQEFNNYDFKNANLFEDSLFNGDNTITFDYWGDDKGRNQALKIINKVWKEKGYGTTYNSAHDLMEGIDASDKLAGGSGIDQYSILKFNDDLTISEKIKALEVAVQALKDNKDYDEYNQETYTILTDLLNDLTSKDSPYGKMKDSADNELSTLIKMTAGYGKDDVNSLEDYTKYRQELIDEISKNKTIKEYINEGMFDKEHIEQSIDSYLSELEEYHPKYTEYAKAFDISQKINEIKKTFGQSNTVQDSSWKLAEQRVNDFNNWINNLSDEDKEIVYTISCNTDTAEYTLDDWENALENYKQTVDEISQNASNELVNTQSIISSISSVKDALLSQSTGNSLSLEDYDSDELKEYTSALEYHNGVLQLNAEKVREIVKAKSEEQIETNNTNKAMAQSTYLENAAKIEKLRQEIKGKTGESKKSIQNEINALLEENSAIKESCDSYDLMTASLQEATDAYHNWLNAQNASQSGDMFDDALNAVNRINETLNKSESEYYGRVGRSDYQTSLELIIPDSVDSSDKEKVNSYLKSIYDLFTYDEDGNYAGLNIENFCQKAVDKGLMVFDKSKDSYKIAGQKTMEDFAEGLKLSMPIVQAAFGEMEEFGGKFSWADEAPKTIGDLGIAANEAAESLRQMKNYKDLEIRLDVSDIDDSDTKISTLETTIKKMQRIKGKAKVDASEVEYANQIIEYCVAQQQSLSEPIVMRVDTSAISERNSEAIGLIQNFQRAYNDLGLKKALGVDTSDAKAKVKELAGQVKKIDPSIRAQLNLDTSSVKKLRDSIKQIGAEQLVKIGIDDSAIDGWTATNKTATVKYDKDTTEIDSYNPKNLERSVTYHVKVDLSGTQALTDYENKLSGKGKILGKKVYIPKSSGNNNINGTAMLGGNWGAKQGGKTLTGELGREIVVDPHTGKWYTVGDNGAEFVDIPKGAVVFNHKQTESLLENGYVAGRASALINGTAMVTGGISHNSTVTSSKSGGNSTGNYGKSSSSKSKSKSSKNKKSSKSKSQKDDFEETFDWVEVAIDRVERAISNLDLKASSVYKSWSTRNKSLTKEISKVTKEINVQQQGYNKYINQANSVGLSKSWRKKVKDGIIDIDTIKNEKLTDKIKEYQQWYEKALECKDAVRQLREQEADLYKQRFDNVVTKYDGILAFNEQKANMLNEQISQTEEKGYIVSGNYYKALIKNERKGISTLEKERTALINKLNKAVNSGKITVGSEAYNEMAKEINEVSLSIAEANTNIIEYNNSIRDIDWQIFDLMQEKISQISKETEFLIDLISSKKLYDNKGQLTDEGWATMSLYTTNYEIYTQQAKEYAKELSDIDNQLKNDPYNQHLIDRRKELLELQQEMISSAEDEKQAIVDMVEEGINLELDALKELIDSYTDALDAQKDLYDYQKKISDQTKDITSLQKQLSAYENDMSEEAKSKIQQIKVSLEEAEEGLEEAEYDQYISDQKNLLDDLYDEYEEILNTRLDNVDALLSDMKDAIDNNKDVISEAINKAASSVGYNETDTLKSALTNVSATISSILASISKMVTDSNASANNSIASTNATITSTPTSSTGSNTVKKGAFGSIPGDSVVQKGDKVKFKKGDLHKTPKKGGGKYEKKSDKWRGKELYIMGVNSAVSTDFPYLLGTNADVDKGTELGWVKKSQISGYSSGIKKILKDELAWTQEGRKAEAIIRPSDGAVLTPLARNDSILNAEATSNLFEFANNPKKFISDNILSDTLKRLSEQDLNVDFTTKYSSDLIPRLSGLTDISNILSTIKNQDSNKDLVSMGDININIPIEHVDDYNDFVTQLKQDKQFEDLIHSFSINLLSGSSKHEKDKYIWQ